MLRSSSPAAGDQLGRLDPRRDLTFVTDTVDGFVRAPPTPGLEGRTIQLGTGRADLHRGAVRPRVAAAGVDAGRSEDDRAHPSGRQRGLGCLSDPPRPAAARLGGRHGSLEDGIAATVDWLRASRTATTSAARDQL